MNRQVLVDVLAAGRVANLPSVVSNVVFGAVTASWLIHANGLNLFWPALAGCGLYLGGCFFNDWRDRKWDAAHKPSRAIPSGRLPAGSVLLLALLFVLAGLLIAFWQSQLAGFVALGIVGSIGIYTWIHKKTVLGILPMGLCRGGLYFLGISSQTLPSSVLKGATKIESPSLISLFAQLVLPALGLAGFVAGLSLLARYEGKGVVSAGKKAWAILLLLLPGFALFQVSFFSGCFGLLGFSAVAFMGANLLRKSIPQGVSFLLASICLVDAFALTILAFHHSFLWPFAGLSLATFALALALQRLASAT